MEEPTTNLEEAYGGTPDEQEAAPERPSRRRKSTIRVRRFVAAPANGHFFCVTEDLEQGYLVPVEAVDFSEQKYVEVDSDIAIPVETWDEEIAAMYPSPEAFARNVRLSLWRAGAFSRDALQNRAVSSRLLRTAFPYPFPFPSDLTE